MFTSVPSLLNKMHLDFHKFVAIIMDGATTMTGDRHGLVAILRKNVPQMMGIHCIAHREASAQDANMYFLHLNFINQATNQVYK